MTYIYVCVCVRDCMVIICVNDTIFSQCVYKFINET